MKWRVLSHSFKDIVQYLSKLIASGVDKINDIRVIYITDDSGIVYMLSAFDFIDLKLEEEAVKFISLCQMITN